MLIIGLFILFILIGIILSIVCENRGYYDCDFAIIGGVTFIVLGGIGLFTSLLLLTLKPLAYKNFKIEYDTIKETMTYKDDIRDAAFTQNIIEINQEIRSCREYKDSIWVGIFQIEGICNAELLGKGDKNE